MIKEKTKMSEYEKIQKLIEPFSFIDGKIYFSTDLEKKIECNMLWVATSSNRVTIYDNSNYYARNEEHLSTLGCDKVSPLHCCEVIRSAMQKKFGVWNVICSKIACTDDYLKLYQFFIQPDKNIRYR